jgi:hypothetical protein
MVWHETCSGNNLDMTPSHRLQISPQHEKHIKAMHTFVHGKQEAKASPTLGQKLPRIAIAMPSTIVKMIGMKIVRNMTAKKIFIVPRKSIDSPMRSANVGDVEGWN